jgi:flagellar assembly factor FliW
MSTVTIDSPRFGTLEIASEDVIEFPHGLIGLGGSRFAIVEREGSFSWLHSIDDPSLALPVTNPWDFFADYAVELSDEDSEPITAAPILVAEGQGHQVINESPDAPVRAPLFPAVAAAA